MVSEGGIVIRKDGSLTLNSDRTELYDDEVKSGGTLRVKSHHITLNSGVVIEAGATAEFITN